MIFVDSNVPMYLIGAAHPNKDRTVAVLTRLTQAGETFVTDVEVYQEMLHRYVAIGRLEAIDPAFASLDALVDDIFAFGVAEVRAARLLLESVSSLSARDALHAAVMASRRDAHLQLRSGLRRRTRTRAAELVQMRSGERPWES